MAGAATDRALRDKLVVLIGGGGFIGRHVAQELLARGARLRVVGRHVERAYAIKALGDLGQVQFARLDVTRDEARLAAALAGADAVVNLAGAFAGNLDALQGKGAGKLASVARAAGVGAFVQVSAIGADAGSDVAYARTKGEGEQAVLAAFPQATVVRPSLVFGADDQLLNLFGRLIATLPVVPVLGAEAKLQPVFVDDVARAIATALADPLAHGKTYELAGPEVLTMLELNRRIAEACGRRTLLVPVGGGITLALASLTGWLPGAPITRAQAKLLNAGSVASGTLPGLAELGVSPSPLELFLGRWMLRYREHGRFGGNAAV